MTGLKCWNSKKKNRQFFAVYLLSRRGIVSPNDAEDKLAQGGIETIIDEIYDPKISPMERAGIFNKSLKHY